MTDELIDDIDKKTEFVRKKLAYGCPRSNVNYRKVVCLMIYKVLYNANQL